MASHLVEYVSSLGVTGRRKFRRVFEGWSEFLWVPGRIDGGGWGVGVERGDGPREEGRCDRKYEEFGRPE